MDHGSPDFILDKISPSNVFSIVSDSESDAENPSQSNFVKRNIGTGISTSSGRTSKHNHDLSLEQLPEHLKENLSLMSTKVLTFQRISL